MVVRFSIGALSLIALSACGGGDTPQIDAADTPPVQTDQETDTGASADYGPPALEFAEDGDVITAKVGEEFSFNLELPDSVSTAINWQVVDGAYEPVVEYDKTWRAQEGRKRYSEIVLRGAEIGETTITYHVMEFGQRYSDEERTLTFRISP